MLMLHLKQCGKSLSQATRVAQPKLSSTETRESFGPVSAGSGGQGLKESRRKAGHAKMQKNSSIAHTSSPKENSPETDHFGDQVATSSGSDPGSDAVGPIIMRWRDQTSHEEPWNVYHAGLSNELASQRNERMKKASNDNVLV